MLNFVRRLSGYLAIRLFILLALVMATVLSVSSALSYNTMRKELTDAVQLSAERISDVIKRSTRYSMLINRKEDLPHTISAIGNQPGLINIRIYSSVGEVLVSTDPAEIRTQVGLSEEICRGCHAGPVPAPVLKRENMFRNFRDDKHHILGVINPILNEPGCDGAGCHPSPDEQKILGLLDVCMSLDHVDAQLAANRRFAITSSALLILSVTLLAGGFVWLMVHRPVRRLTVATRALASGNLNYAIPVHSSDEIGELALSFQRMTKELRQAQKDLEQVMNHMIYVAKMTSLGKLSATVAHELNNPLTGIHTYAKVILKMIESGVEQTEFNEALKKYMPLIRDETARCGNIVRNLLLFARPEIAEIAKHSLHSVLEHGLMLIQHQLEMQNITLEKKFFEGDDIIHADANQLEQALLAMLVNTVEAMPNHGHLLVETQLAENDKVRIRIKDTGVGIPPEIMDKIFDPFFTTKSEGGKSLGLGLSVAYGIVERHNGHIFVESEPGKGATFTVEIPRYQEAAKTL